MTRLFSTFVAISLIVSAPSARSAQQALESEVKTDVRAAWDAYIEAFSRADTDAIANDVYAAPSFQLGDTGANVRVTVADTKTAFDTTHARLAPERYDRSETDQAEICVINGGTALLTAYFTRYRTDESVLLSGASAYLFARFEDGWRIVAIMGNPSRKLISCEE